jgi:4-hydroxybenzoate polyprenyltransferase
MNEYRVKIRLLLVHILKSTKYYSKKYFKLGVNWLRRHWPPIRKRLFLYTRLSRLDRPIGAMLLLWPTLWALWLASAGFPSLHLFLVFSLGVFLTRSAGCVVNDMADRDFDRHVKRTHSRPLTAGEIESKEASLVAFVLIFIAFLLVLTTNRFTVYLSFIAIPLIGIYPFMKRYTYIAQFFLGIAFSWGIPMAFAAQTNSIPNIAWLLFIANILWVVIYDTIYAMVDREYDLKIGIKSTAILFDDADRFFIGIFQLMLLVVLIVIGIQIQADMIYYWFLVVSAGLMLYHQYIIRNRGPDECFEAFLSNNWLGMTIFGGFLFNYL